MTSISSLLTPPRPQPPPAPLEPVQAIRQQALHARGGAFLGVDRGRWVNADPEHAVLVIGPPRSGKSSGVVIPALLGCQGAALSTSTKPDILAATLRARQQVGEVWRFDPTGETADGDGVRRLCWSPVAAATSWDQALLTARSMALAAPALGKGTQHEAHWSERAAALLAPLLYAASLESEPIATVLRWVLRGDLDTPGHILQNKHAEIACDVLYGLAHTDRRERSSIFSATAGVLALYNSDRAREAAARPNFDPDEFAHSTDTVYITAPAHRQALCAPLIVGLIEQIRHATYRRAQTNPRGLPVTFLLDELANVAPLHDLPAFASEGGGQQAHLVCCLQDLSQARQRWGDAAAEGLLSLFQTKLILPGVSDPRTLEAISLVLGDHDRPTISRTAPATQHPLHGCCGPTIYQRHTPTDPARETVTYATVRERKLAPGEIADLPKGQGLLLRGASHELITTTPYYKHPPWNALARTPNPT